MPELRLADYEATAVEAEGAGGGSDAGGGNATLSPGNPKSGERAGLWDPGAYPHFCDTREASLLQGGGFPFTRWISLWEAHFVVSQKWSGGPLAFGRIFCKPRKRGLENDGVSVALDITFGAN